MKNQSLEPLLTEKDAAPIIGMSVSWLQRARWKGGGPEYIKIRNGRAVRYELSSLMRWIEVNRRTPGGEQ
jgi:predicted DNA-binding transcriptional regulator AlpA